MLTYWINFQKVSKQEFDDFKNSLKGEENWVCSETPAGGIVTYEAENNEAQWFIVKEETGGENKQSIYKKNPLQ